ncbi:hypothetical protein ABPG72_019082 [Tetrahymena utriculariae]
MEQINFDEYIRVIIRKKPLTLGKSFGNFKVCINQVDNCIVIKQSSDEQEKTYLYNFDTIFDETCTQQQIYRNAISPLIYSLFQGISATIWAYGQSGSGKTYTLIGFDDKHENLGQIFLSAYEILGIIKSKDYFNCVQQQDFEEFVVYMSIYTLSNEIINDMLSDNHESLKIKQQTQEEYFYIESITKLKISNEQEFLDALHKGINKKNLNNKIKNQYFFVDIFLQRFDQDQKLIKSSFLRFIDFIGCQRTKRNYSSEYQREIIQVYTSLCAFNRVICQLQNLNAHIPYRDSQLTKLMKSSLGGNSRALMICNLNIQQDIDEIHSLLRSAKNVQEVKNFVWSKNYIL